jgi:NADPH2:quinone reductase
VSGKLTGQALASLAFGGTIVVAGYAGGREAEVNVTDIIWKGATIRGFTFRLFAEGRQGLPTNRGSRGRSIPG